MFEKNQININKFYLTEYLYNLKIVNTSFIILNNISHLNNFYYNWSSKKFEFFLKIELKNISLKNKVRFLLHNEKTNFSIISKNYQIEDHFVFMVLFKIENLNMIRINNLSGSYCIGLYFNEVDKYINCQTFKINLEALNNLKLKNKVDDLFNSTIELQTNYLLNAKCLFLTQSEHKFFETLEYLQEINSIDILDLSRNSSPFNYPILKNCLISKTSELNKTLLNKMRLIGLKSNSVNDLKFLTKNSFRDNSVSNLISSIEIQESEPKILMMDNSFANKLNVTIKTNSPSTIFNSNLYLKLVNLNNPSLFQFLENPCLIVNNLLLTNKANYPFGKIELNCVIKKFSDILLNNPGLYYFDVFVYNQQTGVSKSLLNNNNYNNFLYLSKIASFKLFENYTLLNSVSENLKFIKIKFEDSVFNMGHYFKIKCRFRYLLNNERDGIFNKF
jgi:hypothetical protein